MPLDRLTKFVVISGWLQLEGVVGGEKTSSLTLVD